MANLPDLNTATMGLTAFWNVNATVTQADINTLIANMFSHTLYDNGFDGTVRCNYLGSVNNLNGGLLFNVRVRTDGLIVVWMPRSNDPDLNGPSSASQRQVVGTGYPATRGQLLASSGYNNRQTYTVWAGLLDALENMMTTTPFKTVVNVATVGHYDFQFPTMTKIYVLGREPQYGAGGGAAEAFSFTQPSSGNAVLFLALNMSGARFDGGSGSWTSTHAIAVNGLSISFTRTSDGSQGFYYYTLFPGHTNWPLSAIGTINNCSVTATGGSDGNDGKGTVGYIVIYCVET